MGASDAAGYTNGTGLLPGWNPGGLCITHLRLSAVGTGLIPGENPGGLYAAQAFYGPRRVYSNIELPSSLLGLRAVVQGRFQNVHQGTYGQLRIGEDFPGGTGGKRVNYGGFDCLTLFYRSFILLDARSGCSAGGSAPRLGRGGRRFESAHPDLFFCRAGSPVRGAEARCRFGLFRHQHPPLA